MRLYPDDRRRRYSKKRLNSIKEETSKSTKDTNSGSPVEETNSVDSDFLGSIEGKSS